MKTPELCIEVAEHTSCMAGDVLLAALAVECVIYLILFVTGFKLIEHLKKSWRNSKKRR
jgi:hypothetical protein